MFVGIMSYAQRCPQLVFPTSGATNVPVESTISWEEIVGVPGYRIALGSTPGADDIVQEQSVGSATFFTPPLGLQENTTIYVTITLFFFTGQSNIVCGSIPFTTETITSPPECTTLRTPAIGTTNVNIATSLRWNSAARATSYILNVGTAPGLGDIVNQNVGNTTFFDLPMDLDTDTDYFVQITPINRIGTAINCTTEQFRTGAIALLPGCTRLLSPVNGATDVPLTPFLEWEEVPDAIGYRVSIGTSPFIRDILNEGIFSNTSTFVVEFLSNRTFFVTIIPFNAAGEAIGCGQESFSTAIGCGPFFNSITGELITLFPDLNFPDTFSLCESALPIVLSTDAVAETIRWVRTTSDGFELEVLSETQEVSITEGGFYRLEALNFADPDGNNIPCPAVQDFTVDVFEGPTITNVDVSSQGDTLRFTVDISGTGDFEYALNDPDGPYQNSNIFDNVPLGVNTVYVRDRRDNSCIVSQTVEQDLIADGFPNFFTPNGDGINDFWQFMPPPNAADINLITIFIFNRFGQLLVQLDPTSVGWNGTFNGRPLPSSDYWFRALSDTNREIRGHFALRR